MWNHYRGNPNPAGRYVTIYQHHESEPRLDFSFQKRESGEPREVILDRLDPASGQMRSRRKQLGYEQRTLLNFDDRDELRNLARALERAHLNEHPDLNLRERDINVSLRLREQEEEPRLSLHLHEKADAFF